jgi:hypothetical protein
MPKSKKSKLVVIRTNSAGVHVGKLVSKTATTVRLAESRRIWQWFGANTLNEVASSGTCMLKSRLSEPVASIELQWIEIIDVANPAIASLTTSRWAD